MANCSESKSSTELHDEALKQLAKLLELHLTTRSVPFDTLWSAFTLVVSCDAARRGVPALVAFAEMIGEPVPSPGPSWVDSISHLLNASEPSVAAFQERFRKEYESGLIAWAEYAVRTYRGSIAGGEKRAKKADELVIAEFELLMVDRESSYGIAKPICRRLQDRHGVTLTPYSVNKILRSHKRAMSGSNLADSANAKQSVRRIPSRPPLKKSK